MSLQQAIFPSQWKRTNVSPVFKNNKPNEVKNYTIYSKFSIRLCISLGGVPLLSSIFDCSKENIKFNCFFYIIEN
jgi:hypothetical protein